MNRAQKWMLTAVIGVVIVSFTVTCISASPEKLNTPLYTHRMEQISCKMNFLPTQVNSFAYTAEKGYTVDYDVVGCCNVGEEPPLTWNKSTCFNVTCGVTCRTCYGTCHTCRTCNQYTCKYTCYGTCWGPTCGHTCTGYTCGVTCYGTCRVTCWDFTCWDTCRGYTCRTCYQGTCGVTCYGTCWEYGHTWDCWWR